RGDRCGQSRSHARQSLTSQADDRDRTVTGQGTRYAAVAVNPADGPRSRRTAEWVPAQFEGADVFTLAVAGGAGAPNGDAPDPRRRGVSAQVVDRAGVSVVGQPLWMTFRIVAERPAVVFHVLVVDVSVVVLADFAAVFHAVPVDPCRHAGHCPGANPSRLRRCGSPVRRYNNVVEKTVRRER